MERIENFIDKIIYSILFQLKNLYVLKKISIIIKKKCLKVMKFSKNDVIIKNDFAQ